MGLTEPLSEGISAGPMVAKLTDPLGGPRLLGRTQTFRDRVKGDNGSLEDDCLEGLYDPILRTVRDFSGVSLSDLEDPADGGWLRFMPAPSGTYSVKRSGQTDSVDVVVEV